MGESGRARRVLAWGALGAVGAVLVAGVVAHLSPVRLAVLRYAVAQLDQRTGIRLEASGLDYNLLTLSAALADVRVSMGASPDQPFFEAASAGITLDSSSLGGALRFEAITVTEGRLAVIQRGDGTSNLPGGGAGGDSGPPAALRVDRLVLDRLAIDYRGAGDELLIDVPGLSAELTPVSGTLALDEPASIATGETRTEIEALGGGVRFDGRAVYLNELTLRTDVVEAIVDGTLTVLVDNPGLALQVQGRGQLERLARWGGLEGDAPAGDVEFAAALTGPLGEPEAALTLTVPRLTWRSLELRDTTARARVSASGLDLEAVNLLVAGGAVRATGALVAGEPAVVRAEASWEGIDAAALVTELAPGAPLVPAGTLSGRATIEGPVADLVAWRGSAELRLSADANAGGRLAMPGAARIALDGGAWTLDGSHQVAGEVPVTIELAGQLDGGDLLASTLGGAVEVAETELGTLARALDAVGFLDSSDTVGVGGRLAARARVGGRLGAPLIDAEATATTVSGPRFEAPRLALAVDGQPTASGALSFSLASTELTLAGQSVADLRINGRHADGVVTIDAATAAQPMADGRVELAGSYQLDGGRYDVRGAVAGWAVVSSGALPAAALVEARISGTGSLDAPTGTGRVTLTGARWRQVGIGDVQVDFAADGNEVTFSARVPAYAATATGRLGVAAPYSGAVDLRVEAVDLAHATDGLDLPVELAGTASLTAHAEGQAARWRDAVAGWTSRRSMPASAR